MVSRCAQRENRPTRCAAILVYSSVRDWTRFCYVIRFFKNIRIHLLHVIGFVADLFFSTAGERIQKYQNSQVKLVLKLSTGLAYLLLHFPFSQLLKISKKISEKEEKKEKGGMTREMYSLKNCAFYWKFIGGLLS